MFVWDCVYSMQQYADLVEDKSISREQPDLAWHMMLWQTEHQLQ